MAGLEAILGRLLVPDNDVIQQATQELKEVYKHPSVVPGLCECLAGSVSIEVRQYASVLLRRRLVKMWKHLQDHEKSSIKQHVLGALDRETERPVRRSLAHLVAVIASQELSAGRWNELYHYVELNCASSDPRQREVAILLLSNLLESAPEPFQPKFKTLLSMLANTLQDTASKLVPYYTIKCLTAMVEFVGDDELPVFRSLVPMVLIVLKQLILEDEDYACEAMELFDELLECEVAILVPHSATVVSFLLEVGVDGNLGDDVRVKALSLVSSVAVTKKSAISKPEMLQKVLMAVLGILVDGVDSAEDANDEDNEEDLTNEMDAKSPYSSAAKILDTLAIHLSPKVIYPAVVQLIQPWFTNESSKHRKAAILSVAVLCEGCSDHITETGQLRALLEFAYRGLQDDDLAVRNASLFAIGQFSEHLQPDINKYASDILPVLLGHLQKLGLAVSGNRRGVTKAFYALDMFCESLGKDVVQYLGTIMEKVVHVYQAAENVTVKELVVSSFGALASAAEKDFLPYFPKVVEILKECLVLRSQPASLDMLHGQVMDTLGVLARTVGPEHFMPLAQECLQLGMNGMQSDEPDLRGAVYGMFAALSTVLKEDMSAHLEPIVIRMLEALQSDEGVKVHYDEPSMGGLFDFDEIDDEGQDEDDDEEDLEDVAAIKGVTVENAYLEEKEDACNALGEIAVQTGAAFLPHLDDTYREIMQLIDHTSPDLRKASVTSLALVFKAWLSLWAKMNEAERVELSILINTTVEVMMAAATTDTDHMAAFAFLEALEIILRACKGKPQLEGKTTKELLQGIQDFLTKQAVCQGSEEGGGEADEDEAEVERLLTEAAGSLVPPLVWLIGVEQIWPQIEAFFANLAKSLRPNSSVSEKSYVVGTLGELVDAVGSHAVHFVGSMELFLKHLADKDSEVRNNAAFAVGVLAANAASALEVHYPTILQQLFAAVDKEDNGRCIDNIIAAVCRMITAKPEIVPLEQVLPVVIQKLPLREDDEEYKTVYRVLRDLLRVRHHIVLGSLPALLKVFAHDASKLCDDESKVIWRDIIQFLSTECLDQFQAASANLTPDELQVLTAAMQ